MNDYIRSIRVPLFCPLCSRVMKGSKSNITYYEHNCCNNCFIGFVEGREDKWKTGARPSKQEVEAYYEKLEVYTPI